MGFAQPYKMRDFLTVLEAMAGQADVPAEIPAYLQAILCREPFERVAEPGQDRVPTAKVDG
jgi:hypothetical protein